MQRAFAGRCAPRGGLRVWAQTRTGVVLGRRPSKRRDEPPAVDLSADFPDVLQHVRGVPAASAGTVPDAVKDAAGGGGPTFAVREKKRDGTESAAEIHAAAAKAAAAMLGTSDIDAATTAAASQRRLTTDDLGRRRVGTDEATGEGVFSSSEAEAPTVHAPRRGHRGLSAVHEEGDDVADPAAVRVAEARERWEASSRRLAALHPALSEGGIAEGGRKREAVLSDRQQAVADMHEMHEQQAATRGWQDPSRGRFVDDDGELRSDAPAHVIDMTVSRLEDLPARAMAIERSDTHLPRRLGAATALLDPFENYDALATGGAGNLLLGGLGTGDEPAPANEPAGFADAALTVGRMLGDHDTAGGADQLARLVQEYREAGAEGAVAEEDGQDPDSGFGRDVLRPTASAEDGVHLLRALQRVGLCSRREAIEKVASGQVMVNQRVVRDPFRRVVATDDMNVEGYVGRLRFAPPRLWMFHKPENVLIGADGTVDKVLFRRYAQMFGHEHMVPIGSLPFTAHGLVLVTNDGDLARFLQHPSVGLQQTWVARVRPAISPLLAHKFNTEGVDINGVRHRDFEFSHFGTRRAKATVKIRVNHGAKMPVTTMLQHLGRSVHRASRRSVGPFYIGGLAPGQLKEVAVPPYFAKYTSRVWMPFIDRDWPYFRRLRIARLKSLARYRMLTDAERDELDTFSADELRDSTEGDRSEVAAEAQRFAESIRSPPSVDAPPLRPYISPDDVESF